MLGWFHHWIYTDLWIPVWPNLLAATIPVVSVVKLTQIVKRHHREHRERLERLENAVQDRERRRELPGEE